MTRNMILERTGDSRWYLKHTDVADRPEIAALLVIASVGAGLSDAENVA